MPEYTSQEVGELAKALINVQRQLQPAIKDANNPFTKSKYATLNLADPVMVPYQPEELAAALERFAKYDLKVTIV